MRDPDNHVLISRLTVLELPSVFGVKVRTNVITREELRDSELDAAERLIADYAHDLRLRSRLQISAARPEKQPVCDADSGYSAKRYRRVRASCLAYLWSSPRLNPANGDVCLAVSARPSTGVSARWGPVASMAQHRMKSIGTPWSKSTPFLLLVNRRHFGNGLAWQTSTHGL
jgi:hypothetical protein